MSAWRSMRRLVGYRRGSFPRSLTIYAGNVENVSYRGAEWGTNSSAACADDWFDPAASGPPFEWADKSCPGSTE
jgi:hypothetical protein